MCKAANNKNLHNIVGGPLDLDRYRFGLTIINTYKLGRLRINHIAHIDDKCKWAKPKAISFSDYKLIDINLAYYNLHATTTSFTTNNKKTNHCKKIDNPR